MIERTISERLADYGVTHEGWNDGGGRRLLRFNSAPLGLADSAEATALLDLLDSVGAQRRALVGEIDKVAKAAAIADHDRHKQHEQFIDEMLAAAHTGDAPVPSDEVREAVERARKEIERYHASSVAGRDTAQKPPPGFKEPTIWDKLAGRPPQTHSGPYSNYWLEYGRAQGCEVALQALAALSQPVEGAPERCLSHVSPEGGSTTEPVRHASADVDAGVREALHELLTAVKYKAPPVNFGTEAEPNPCFEARVPVEFVRRAEAALAAYDKERAALSAKGDGESSTQGSER